MKLFNEKTMAATIIFLIMYVKIPKVKEYIDHALSSLGKWLNE